MLIICFPLDLVRISLNYCYTIQEKTFILIYHAHLVHVFSCFSQFFHERVAHKNSNCVCNQKHQSNSIMQYQFNFNLYCFSHSNLG